MSDLVGWTCSVAVDNSVDTLVGWGDGRRQKEGFVRLKLLGSGDVDGLADCIPAAEVDAVGDLHVPSTAY